MDENKIILAASSEDSDANKSSPILGKVEIRFWSKATERYQKTSAYIVVDFSGAVYEHIKDGQLIYRPDLEPHFYKDGERIA